MLGKLFFFWGSYNSPLSKKLLNIVLISENNKRISRNRDVETTRCKVNDRY